MSGGGSCVEGGRRKLTRRAAIVWIVKGSAKKKKRENKARWEGWVRTAKQERSEQGVGRKKGLGKLGIQINDPWV